MRIPFATLTALSLVIAGCSVKDTKDGGDTSEMSAATQPSAPAEPANVFADGRAMPLDIAQTHPNGTTVKLESIQATPTETLVTMTIDNQHDTEIILNSAAYGTYIFSPDGAKLKLEPPAQNKELEIPPGQSVQAQLVFSGTLARGGPATLFINNAQYLDNKDTRYPGFRIPINLDETAFTQGGSKKKLSDLRSLPSAPIASASLAKSTVTPIAVLKSELGAKSTVRGTVVALPGDVLFDFDKATIRDDARPVLDKLAQLIAADPGKSIAIEGYTDSKGDDAYNLALSKRRAQAVRDYLAGQKVDAALMSVKGLGEGNPAADNTSDAGRQKNRRVEVVIASS